jgi:hypothetical protein
MKQQFLVIYRPLRHTFVDDISDEEGGIKGEFRSYRVALRSQR